MKPLNMRLCLSVACMSSLWLSACASLSPMPAPEVPVAVERLSSQLYAPDYETAYDTNAAYLSLGEIGGDELSRLLETLANDNFDMAQARARLEQAQAAQDRASGARLPNLSYNASVGPSRSLNFLSPQPRWTTTGSGALSANWDLDIFGGLREEARAAYFETAASKLSAQRLRQTLSAQLTSSYIAAWALSEQLRLTRALAESFEQTAELTNERYRTGSNQVSALDVQIARQNAVSTRANVPELTAQYRAQLFVIDTLLARPAGETALTYEEIGSALNLPTVPAGLPVDLLRRRADVAASEMQLLAAYSDIHVAQAQTKPSLSLSGTFSQNTLEIKDVFDVNTLGMNVLAGLAGPIFNGGQLRAGVKIAQARRDELAAAYAQSAYSAYCDVRTAMEFEDAYRDKLSQIDLALSAAELSDKIASERYASGQVSLLTVLETRRALFTARQNRVTAQQQGLQARSDLLLALGAEWGGNTAALQSEDIPQATFSQSNPILTKAKEALTK